MLFALPRLRIPLSFFLAKEEDIQLLTSIPHPIVFFFLAPGDHQENLINLKALFPRSPPESEKSFHSNFIHGI